MGGKQTKKQLGLEDETRQMNKQPGRNRTTARRIVRRGC